MSEIVTKICKTCQKEFIKKDNYKGLICNKCIYESKKRNIICDICNKKCISIHKTCMQCKHRQTYIIKEKKCIHCKKVFNKKYAVRYCGIDCKIKHNIKINKDGCWIWQLWTDRGAPQTNICGKIVSVTRISYSHYIGEIKKGYIISHRCDNINCVNPKHLIEETEKEFNSRHKYDIQKFKKNRLVLHWRRKISELSIEKIFELKSLGYTAFEIARLYNERHEENFRNLNIQKYNLMNPPSDDYVILTRNEEERMLDIINNSDL
jgi:hypothetical protein